MSTIEQIINGDIDLYQYINVNPNADISTIRRQYRKTALLYHPDKNNTKEANDKFQLLSQIFDILNNQELRHNYDQIRHYKVSRELKSQELNERTRQFKEQLLKAEAGTDAKTIFEQGTNNHLKEDQWYNQVEKLKEDGMRRRRQLEKSHFNQQEGSFEYIPYTKIPVLKRFSMRDMPSARTKVIVKWKNRPELKEVFTMDVLSSIMNVFGPIENIEEIPSNDSNYRLAIIQFIRPEDAHQALLHNYKQTASYWDGSPYRKLASLLRSCKPYKKAVGLSSNSLDMDKFHRLLRQENIPHEASVFTDVPEINSVLVGLIKEEIDLVP